LEIVCIPSVDCPNCGISVVKHGQEFRLRNSGPFQLSIIFSKHQESYLNWKASSSEVMFQREILGSYTNQSISEMALQANCLCHCTFAIVLFCFQLILLAINILLCTSPTNRCQPLSCCYPLMSLSAFISEIEACER